MTDQKLIDEVRERLKRGDSIEQIVSATKLSQAKVYEIRKYMGVRPT